MEVIGEVRVLCVGEQTEYLMLALNPNNFSSASSVSTDTTSENTRENQRKTGGVMILPTQCTTTAFETFPLEDYDVIILADVPKISDQMRLQLQEFIRHGKSVIVFLSSRSDIINYNELRDTWLPAEVGNPLTWTPPQRVGTYQELHPIFDIFPSEGLSTQYAPQFYNGVVLQPTPESKVIARFENDTPFLVERIRGTSTVLLYNCALLGEQGAANDLLVNPYFLPLIQQSVLYTAMAGSNLLTWGGHVGDTYTAYYPRSAGGKASIGLVAVSSQLDGFETDKTLATARRSTDSDFEVAPITEDGALRFQGTERPGIYQIEVQTSSGIQRDFFAVNVDTSESELVQIPLQQAAARVGAQTTITENSEALAVADDPYDVRRHGREIWGELLILAICFMLLESFLSNRESALTVGEKQ